MTKIIICTLFLLSTISCTNYEKNKPWYYARNYSEVKLEDNKYLLFMEGDESKEFIKDFLILRTAKIGLENNYPYFSIDSEESKNDLIISKGVFWRLSSFRVEANSPNIVTIIVSYHKKKPSSKNILDAKKEIERIKSSYGKWYFKNVSQNQIRFLLYSRPKELFYQERNERARLRLLIRNRKNN